MPNIYFLVIAAGLIGAIGDALLNQWAKNGGRYWLLSAYIVWIITATIVGFLLKKEFFGIAIVMFLLSNIAFVLIISRFHFSEHLSPMQWLGIAIAIIAVVLMEQGK